MEPSATAVLTIDMQNDVLESIVPTGREVVPAIQEALRAARAAGIPVIHCVRHHRRDGCDVERFRLQGFLDRPFLVPGTAGAELIPELAARTDEIQVPKARFSAFFQTDLLLVLMRLGVRNLVLVGVQTPNCVRCTATDALSYDFDVVLLEDAIAAATPQVHEANLFDMANMGMSIMPVARFVQEIGTPTAA
jgi:nicotinamidase-related amidase